MRSILMKFHGTQSQGFSWGSSISIYFHTCEQFCYRIEEGPGAHRSARDLHRGHPSPCRSQQFYMRIGQGPRHTAGAPPPPPPLRGGRPFLTRVKIQELQKIPLDILKQVWIWFEIGTPTEKGHIKIQKTPGRLFFLDEL